LISVDTSEFDGVVHWRSQYPFEPMEF
jgi:hypothetical protein